jgi:hypothetical protein
MKPKIITGNETVGWYCFKGVVAPKQFNKLTQEEQEDYLTEDDDRKFIYIQFSDFVDDELELYFDKNDLITSVIEETDYRIQQAEREILSQKKILANLISKNSEYQTMLEQKNET